MAKLFLYLGLSGGFFLLVSCGNSNPSAEAAASSPQSAYRVKSGDLFDDDSQAMISRYGATNPNMSKNGQGGGSATEASAVDNHFTGEFAKREFNGKNYDKKSFWGSKDYAKKVYGGNTDGSRFRDGARESLLGAREGAMVSRESNRTHDKGRQFGGAANENSTAGVTTQSDAQTDFRRSVFTPPPVENVQRKRALTVEDTKSILGR